MQPQSQPKQKKLVQIGIASFLVEKKIPNEPFVPIDVVRQPVQIVKKKRGRPRKYPQAQAAPAQVIEELEIELEPGENEDRNEIKKRGPYHKLKFSQKLAILNNFIDYKQNPPLINGRPQA